LINVLLSLLLQQGSVISLLTVPPAVSSLSAATITMAHDIKGVHNTAEDSSLLGYNSVSLSEQSETWDV
jgi:hypothetical protein